MSARALDTDEDAEVDAQPCWVRSPAVTALVVARETANSRYNTLEGERTK